MSRKRRNGRLYWKGGGCYGDFRDLGGKLEALKPPGERLATTDGDIGALLITERVKELESIRRGIALVGRGREEALGRFAQHHLERKIVGAGRLLDIPCYDHVILAGDRYVSFAESGLL